MNWPARRSTLRRLTSLAISCFAAFALYGCSKEEGGAANVIFISIDTLRADHVGAYGYEKPTTPNIDHLAGEGALFETVIAESSWTLPTHMTMMTGLTSKVHGVLYDAFGLDPERETLAEVLQERGYETFGLYSAPYLHPMFGFGQGFDSYESVVDFQAYDNPEFELKDLTDEMKQKLGEQDHGSHRTVTTPEIVDRTIGFIEQNKDERFFAFLHLFDVHSDYIPPEEDWRLFDPDYQGKLDGKNFWFNEKFRPGMNRDDYEHILALYDGEIHFVDRHLQRLFAKLEELGLEEDTLIVITSDHGEEFLEHGGKAHRYTLFDEVLKVPLIFRWKGHIPAGRRHANQVRQVEIMPTILSLLGIRAPEGVMGKDLKPAILDGVNLASIPAASRLVWPGTQYWNSMRLEGSKYLSSRPSVPTDGLPVTTDPELLGAREAFERSDKFENEVRAQLAQSSEGRRVDADPRMLAELAKLGYIGNVEVDDSTLGDAAEIFFDLKNDPKEQKAYRAPRSPR
ncbi:MAG: sulfatase [Planctomycetota bacterium]